jgi:hypothetical protein
MKYRLSILILALLLVLWSCGENSLLLGNVDEPAQLSVESLDPGSMVGPDAEIPLRIARDPVYTGDQSTADRLLVELLDHEGTVLAEQTYDSVDQATDLPPLTLPGLEDGLYSLRTVYLDGEDEVTDRTVPFFVASGSYRILGLTSYPASSYPEADGLLRVSLDVPAGADPFLVWWLDGRVIESGYLSQTGRTVAVLAPAAQGVFSVRVEVYPVWPEGADFRSVRAPSAYATELYVSDAPSLAGSDLAPESSYFALYHLRGTLGDDGARVAWFPSRDFSAETFGEVRLDARSDVFGYAFDGTSGMRMEGAVWPVLGRELAPVSVSFRLLADRLDGVSTLMRAATRTADLVTVLLDELGRVGLRLAMIDGEVWSSVPMLRPGEPELITISIVPGVDMGRVSFFSGGQAVSSLEVPGLTLGSLPAPRIIAGAEEWSLLDGSTTLGAEDGGFVGIVDEFGVFFRDEDNEPATNTALFAESMRFRYGDRLLYASSFDDASDLNELTASGGVSISDGALRLDAGSSVRLPDLAFEEEDLIVELDLDATLPVDLVVTGATDSRELTVLRLAPGEEPGPVELRMTHREGLLIVRGDGREREVTLSAASEGADFAGVGVTIRVIDARDSDGTVVVRSLAARRDRPRIPERLFGVADE